MIMGKTEKNDTDLLKASLIDTEKKLKLLK